MSVGGNVGGENDAEPLFLSADLVPVSYLFRQKVAAGLIVKIG